MSNSCCPSNDEKQVGRKKIDSLFWGSFIVVLVSFIGAFFHDALINMPILWHFVSTVDEFLRLVWWGILAGIFFVGLLNLFPKDLTQKMIGRAGTAGGVLRAACAGIVFDLCSHGILLVGLKFYERGASLGQVMAFLIASPWNSFSLTLILVALVGLKWTLVFVIASFVIALLSGFIFEALVKMGILPPNPNQTDNNDEDLLSFKEIFQQTDFSLVTLRVCFVRAIIESRVIVKWMFVGIILIGLLRISMDLDMFQTLFAPTFFGLMLTLFAATIIEVCSEGLAPIAADLINRAGAPGNGFTFLMAGVSTDYTEIMGIKETTQSWKIALFLPLVTVPQIIVLGLFMNGTFSFS